jgi:hypothetical protein
VLITTAQTPQEAALEPDWRTRIEYHIGLGKDAVQPFIDPHLSIQDGSLRIVHDGRYSRATVGPLARMKALSLVWPATRGLLRCLRATSKGRHGCCWSSQP